MYTNTTVVLKPNFISSLLLCAEHLRKNCSHLIASHCTLYTVQCTYSFVYKTSKIHLATLPLAV